MNTATPGDRESGVTLPSNHRPDVDPEWQQGVCSGLRIALAVARIHGDARTIESLEAVLARELAQ